MATIEETAELPLNLHEYEAAARDLLSPMTLGYVSGGSCDEVTLRATGPHSTAGGYCPA